MRVRNLALLYWLAVKEIKLSYYGNERPTIYYNPLLWQLDLSSLAATGFRVQSALQDSPLVPIPDPKASCIFNCGPSQARGVLLQLNRRRTSPEGLHVSIQRSEAQAPNMINFKLVDT